MMHPLLLNLLIVISIAFSFKTSIWVFFFKLDLDLRILFKGEIWGNDFEGVQTVGI